MSFTFPIFIWPAFTLGTFSVWVPLASTLAWAFVIGLLATLLAIPVARAFHAPRHTGWLAASMLLPPYMVSVGLNAFRGPGTWIGEAVEKAITSGWTGLPIYLGKGIAGLGLALWVLPLSAALLAAQFRSLDPALIDSMRLEPMGRRERVRQWLQILGPGLVRSVCAVTLLMTGSAVPLHVAQVETLAISVWKLMDQTPAAARGELWLSTWPFVAIAAAAGVFVFISLRYVREHLSRSAEAEARLRASRGWIISGGLVWGLAAVAPVFIALWTVDSSMALRAFWRVSAVAMRDSGVLAAAVGLLVFWISLLIAWMGDIRKSWVCVAVLVAIGVYPGALLGLGVATISRVTHTDDGWLSVGWVVVAHVLRFGWIGGLVGVVLARSEARPQRDHRALDGAMTWFGWVRSCLAWQWGGLVAAGAAAAAMSFSEIESTIFVQPPELESLPRQMLGHLHFSRTSELGAASFYVGAITLVIAAAVGGMASHVAERIVGSRQTSSSETKPTDPESQP